MKKKCAALVLICIMIFTLCACGDDTSKTQNTQGDTSVSSEITSETDSTTGDTKSTTIETIKETESETEATTEQEMKTVGIGQSIETESFKMSVKSIEIVDELVVKTGDMSSFKANVESGYKVLVVKGTMENTGKTVISDSSFYKKAVVNGDYEVGGFDVKLIFERNKYYEIDPYTEQNFFLYVNIPEKLAENYNTASFILGYKDDFSTITLIYESGKTEKSDATHLIEITQ